MKILSGALLLLLCFVSMAAAEKTYFRDKNGRQDGSANTYGNKTYYYDKNGRQAGSANTYGNKTYFRDASGKQSGSAYGKFNPSLGRGKK